MSFLFSGKGLLGWEPLGTGSVHGWFQGAGRGFIMYCQAACYHRDPLAELPYARVWEFLILYFWGQDLGLSMVLSAALAQVAWYELAHKWMNSSAFLRRPPLNLAPSPSASLTFQAESLLALPGPAQVPLLRWTTVGQAPVASVACSRFSCLETT